MQSHVGKHQASAGGRGVGGKHGHGSLLWFPWEEMGEAWEADLGLAGLSKFTGLWGIGAVLSCLIPGQGEIKTRNHWELRTQ